MKTLFRESVFLYYQHLEDQINCSYSTAVFCRMETIKMTPKMESEKELKSVVGCMSLEGVSSKPEEKMSALVDGFLDYATYELNFSPNTVNKYRESLKSFIKHVGDKEVGQLEVRDFVMLKKKLMDNGVGEAYISGLVFAVRSLIGYCRNFLNIQTLDPKQIRPPKKFKREVIFLSAEEIARFIEVINTKKITGLRFRVLVEVLLGTGMRISETLSLNRKTINWERREAKIIGKGNKERTVFFTKRSLDWIRRYLEKRSDEHDAIFVTNGREPRRLRTGDIWRYFGYHKAKARIDKKITPHILRHTVATNLVFNGCPIIHVKEILGHEKLDTTCKYYLGVDKEKAKQAHREYLNFVH